MRLHAILLLAVLGCSLLGCGSGSDELADKWDEQKASTVTPSPSSTATPSEDVDWPVSTPHASAGISFTAWLAGRPIDDQTENSRYDVVTAVVEGVADDNCTNANPPIVTLDIREVLRGDTQEDRRRAVWAPFPHDVDYGTLEDNPIYQNWAKKPLVGPEPGARMILLGEMHEEDGHKYFWISPVGRFELSEENRELAMAGIKRGEQWRQEQEETLALEKQLYQQQMKDWRAQFTSEEIEQFTVAADFVGIGTIVSGPALGDDTDSYSFQVSTILKGKRLKQYKSGSYFARFSVPKNISRLLYTSRLLDPRERRFFLFLSEEERKRGVRVYKAIDMADGIVEADEEALEAVTAALKRDSNP
jgi:hypothetical protein